MPLISVIIPCYNHGIYLRDVVNSIQAEFYKGIFEIIIVNDGSNDPFTISEIEKLSHLDLTILHQKNMGLAWARNNGINLSRGKYILPLDADNLLVPEVFIRAAGVMESDTSIAVAYTDVEYIGDKSGIERIGDFDIHRLLTWNYIDACALISRDGIIKAGLYDPKIPAMGHEDWDLWFSLASMGAKFHYLNEVGFKYRILNNSMSATSTGPGTAQNIKYLFSKHSALVSRSYTELLQTYQQERIKHFTFKKKLYSDRIRNAVRLLVGKKIND